MTLNNAAILEVENQIEQHRSKLTSLERDIVRLDAERKQVEARMPQVKLNLDALNRTLAILRGTTDDENANHKTPVSLNEFAEKTSAIQPGSNTYVAREILNARGNPMSMPDLVAEAATKKQDFKPRSFATNIYRLASEGRYFKVAEKKIRLVEWDHRV